MSTTKSNKQDVAVKSLLQGLSGQRNSAQTDLIAEALSKKPTASKAKKEKPTITIDAKKNPDIANVFKTNGAIAAIMTLGDTIKKFTKSSLVSFLKPEIASILAERKELESIRIVSDNDECLLLLKRMYPVISDENADSLAKLGIRTKVKS